MLRTRCNRGLCMKILMVNKFYYIKGGSETYYFALKRLLESKGHTVIDFSMKDEKNFDSPYSDYFVENIDYNTQGNVLAKIKAGFNIIYSVEAKKKFEQLVKDTKPDLVHLHIFQHQISPSILDVIKKYNLPTVYTAHDLKMLCLNYKMLQHGKICEECKGEKYYHCALNKCVKNSFAKSSINVIEGYIHKWRKSYDAIDKIITPSEFYKRKFEEFGIASERVVHIPNFLETEKPIINIKEDNRTYYLYFGRLSEEKGIFSLLHAFRELSLRLYIVGTGALRTTIEQYIQQNNMRNVQLLGFKYGQELKDIVGNAKAVILPSEWYENGPYSAIEALQLGCPIIGADIGGISELVDGNGILFRSGDAMDLAEKVQKIDEMSKENYSKLETASEKLFKKNYTTERHYQKIEKIYLELIKEKNR